jgi:hypothetical protein
MMRLHRVGWMNHAARPRRLVALVSVSLAACASESTDAGSYRIVTVKGPLLGLGCQPRTELYFVARTSPEPAPVYLGTCGTPRFLVEQLGMPGDPSCYAVAEDGSALVYFHRPNWCGAGERALRKPGGVYRHTPAGGDSLVYHDDDVGQMWSRAGIEPNAIRVSWHGAQPSRGGAECSQNLIIRADGSETAEGPPTTIHGCSSGGPDARPRR